MYITSIQGRRERRGGGGGGGGRVEGAGRQQPIPGASFFFHVKSENIKLLSSFYVGITCEALVYLLNKT